MLSLKKYTSPRYVTQGTNTIIASVVCNNSGEKKAITLDFSNTDPLLELNSQSKYVITYYMNWNENVDAIDDEEWKSILENKCIDRIPKSFRVIESELLNGES